jgi:hypothetical protein
MRHRCLGKPWRWKQNRHWERFFAGVRFFMNNLSYQVQMFSTATKPFAHPVSLTILTCRRQTLWMMFWMMIRPIRKCALQWQTRTIHPYRFQRWDHGSLVNSIFPSIVPEFFFWHVSSFRHRMGYPNSRACVRCRGGSGFLIVCFPVQGLNQFFYMRYPSVTIGGVGLHRRNAFLCW